MRSLINYSKKEHGLVAISALKLCLYSSIFIALFCVSDIKAQERVTEIKAREGGSKALLVDLHDRVFHIEIYRDGVIETNEFVPNKKISKLHTFKARPFKESINIKTYKSKVILIYDRSITIYDFIENDYERIEFEYDFTITEHMNDDYFIVQKNYYQNSTISWGGEVKEITLLSNSDYIVGLLDKYIHLKDAGNSYLYDPKEGILSSFFDNQIKSNTLADSSGAWFYDYDGFLHYWSFDKQVKVNYYDAKIIPKNDVYLTWLENGNFMVFNAATIFSLEIIEIDPVKKSIVYRHEVNTLLPRINFEDIVFYQDKIFIPCQTISAAVYDKSTKSVFHFPINDNLKWEGEIVNKSMIPFINDDRLSTLNLMTSEITDLYFDDFRGSNIMHTSYQNSELLITLGTEEFTSHDYIKIKGSFEFETYTIGLDAYHGVTEDAQLLNSKSGVLLLDGDNLYQIDGLDWKKVNQSRVISFNDDQLFLDTLQPAIRYLDGNPHWWEQEGSLQKLYRLVDGVVEEICSVHESFDIKRYSVFNDDVFLNTSRGDVWIFDHESRLLEEFCINCNDFRSDPWTYYFQEDLYLSINNTVAKFSKDTIITVLSNIKTSHRDIFVEIDNQLCFQAIDLHYLTTPPNEQILLPFLEYNTFSLSFRKLNENYIYYDLNVAYNGENKFLTDLKSWWAFDVDFFDDLYVFEDNFIALAGGHYYVVDSMGNEIREIDTWSSSDDYFVEIIETKDHDYLISRDEYYSYFSVYKLNKVMDSLILEFRTPYVPRTSTDVEVHNLIKTPDGDLVIGFEDGIARISYSKGLEIFPFEEQFFLGKNQLGSQDDYVYYLANDYIYGNQVFRVKLDDITDTYSPQVIPTLNIYPNPVEDQVFIFGDIDNLSYQIYDMAGRSMGLTGALGVNNNISVSHLAAGAYILRVVSNDGIKSLKFVKI